MSQQREINTIETNVIDTSEEETATYQLNIWNIETSQNPPKFSTALKNDLWNKFLSTTTFFEYLLTLAQRYQFATLIKPICRAY